MQGVIDKVVRTRGFGFIRTNEGGHVFFHRISLVGTDFQSLREGQAVDFELQHGDSEVYYGEKHFRAASVRPRSARPFQHLGTVDNSLRI